jgi:hypothetical protein
MKKNNWYLFLEKNENLPQTLHFMTNEDVTPEALPPALWLTLCSLGFAFFCDGQLF